MDPTPRPASWSAWAVPRDALERRVRLTVDELDASLRRLDWTRLPHQIAVYTPKQIRHLIRLETALGRWPPTAAPDRWRAERRPDVDARWRVHDFIQNVRLERPLDGSLSARGGGGAAAGAGSVPPARWEGAARGWAAGALLLAALLLLVRALERCLHRRLFKGRRSSEEWPTPNVLATSHRFGNDMSSIPQLDNSDLFSSDSRESSANDLPPPYSECANNEEHGSIDADKPIGMEEPPPPYSACYFSNPKDGIPTVHFYSRREVGQSSADSEEPVLTNVSEEDKISEVGCEVNVSLENQNNEVISGEDTVEDTNADTRQRNVGERDGHTEHVVEIDVSEFVAQGRAVTV